MTDSKATDNYSARDFHTVETPPAPALDAARKWRSEHSEHVAKITASETASYAPSGSDVRNPALWKAAHWKWLEDTENG